MPGSCPVSASIIWRGIYWPPCSNPTRLRSRSWRCWSPAVIRCSQGWKASVGTRSWAIRSTTRRARPSTRPPSCSISAIPSDRSLPRPLTERPGLDVGVRGLKAAVIVALRDRELDDQTRADAARAFEDAVAETLAIKCERALEQTSGQTLLVAGGVGANRRLRARLLALGSRLGVRVAYPRPEFCTDNAAMIALLGCLRLGAGEHDDLEIRARARWPMSQLAPPATGNSRVDPPQ